MSISNLFKDNDFTIYAKKYFDKDGEIIPVQTGSTIQLTFGGDILLANSYLNYCSISDSTTGTLVDVYNEYIAFGEYKLKSLSWNAQVTGGLFDILVNDVVELSVPITTLSGTQETVAGNIILNNLSTLKVQFVTGTNPQKTQFNMLFEKQ